MNAENRAMELYSQKKIRLAIKGLIIACISSIAYVIFPILNVRGTDVIFNLFDDGGVGQAFVLTLVGLSLCEFVGGICLMGYSTIKIGTPIKEYTRLWQVKTSRSVLLSGLVGGPIGTACTVLAVSLAGSTYAGIMFALLPGLTAIGGKIVFKEKTGPRVILGIAICIVGAIIAGLEPPEGVENFYLGLFLAFLAPVAFTVEAMISTNGMDVSEPFEVCGLFRMCGGGIIELIFALLGAAVLGHMEWVTKSFAAIFSSPMTLLFIFGTAVFMAIQYGGCYASYNLAGPTRGGALVAASPIWSIPIGFLFAAIGFFDYAITGKAILGAFIVVIGAILVVAKPSELFTLRDNQ